MIATGQLAPDFEGTTDSGSLLRLSSFRGEKNVVLYFYPRDFTLVCTQQACMFRDAREELMGKDTEVIGVSTDSAPKHERFVAKHHLNFPLVADPDKRIGRAYGVINGVRGILGMANRFTFVIDKAGIVRGAYRHDLSAQAHLDDVRRLLATMA